MTAIGLDIGGTKIEARVFAEDWSEIGRRRVPTPQDYDALVAAVVDQIAWAEGAAGGTTAVGIGAAGLVNPKTGQAFTANLIASGKPFPRDIADTVGRDVTYINDCNALALSEAVFGAGKGYRTVMGLIIGTGIGGGTVVDGKLLQGPTGTAGEFGHIAAPAHLIVAHNLPIIRCGCGRMGCIETYVAGPGLERLAQHMTSQQMEAPDIAAARDQEMRTVWRLWCALAGEMITGLTMTVDPEVIVLGGGLSAVPGVTQDLMEHAAAAQIAEFGNVPIVLAEGGDASGARGAAYAAWIERRDG